MKANGDDGHRSSREGKREKARDGALDGPRTQTDPCGPTASEKPHYLKTQILS